MYIYIYILQEVLRLKLRISTRATQPLYDLGMNFGVRYSYDAAQCTGPSFTVRSSGFKGLRFRGLGALVGP